MLHCACRRRRLLSRLPTAADAPDASRVAVHYERFLEVGAGLAAWSMCRAPPSRLRALGTAGLQVAAVSCPARHCAWVPANQPLQWPPAPPQLRDVFCVKEFLRGW